MVDVVWLIPALPLAGFVILLVAGKRLGEPWAGVVGTVTVAASFLVTCGVYADLLGREEEHRTVIHRLFTWLPVGGFRVDVGTLADPLSISMCLFVTGIAALIHLYSIGYMHDDEQFPKFFLYLNLFVFSMLVLVLGDTLLLTFVGWEGVGLCSYLLIAFWFTEEANAVAGKKAFITNRVGDVGFMIAMFLAFATVGSLAYAEVLPAAGAMTTTTVTAIAALLFVGAVGKSAQIPLYVWLPDAMAGPTPVSALIHAATMVTAGVYLMVRVNPLLAESSPWLPTTIATIGILTALLAATIAVAQNDIKKVLAYSTISQLGYMFAAIGSGAYLAAVFHVITHAFFKGLMFLAAGSVIHGIGGEQDMKKMGGLRKFMPVTFATFIIGWLAIAGIPPFSGFWSKDDILAFVFHKSPVLWVLGVVTALLTAFYMSRLIFLTFYRAPRWQEGESEIHPHESPWTMTVPLVVLAVFAAAGGLLNLPFGENFTFLERWLHPVIGASETADTFAGSTTIILIVISVAAAFLGIVVAARTYLARKIDARIFEREILARAWRIDGGYAAFFGGPGATFGNAMVFVDTRIIDGAVNGVARTVAASASGLRRLQTGYVRNYALGMAIGAVLLLGWFFSRASI